MNRLESLLLPRCANVRPEPVLRLSVIVPFAIDEPEGTALLEQLQVLPRDSEIVMACAEGYSQPIAQLDANRVATRICISPMGRARQMNVGAKMARGRWLWFLHADTCLRSRSLAALEAFLAVDQDALGYFDLRYRNDGPWLTRCNAFGANLRARWLGMPFGDQGLIVQAAWFERLGGYDENAAYGEDHLLVWRARRAGLPLKRIGASLSSSARKYARHGWWQTTLQHLRLTARQAWPQWRRMRKGIRT